MITVVLVTLLLSAACAEEERNNVIFIIADDFRPNIGALGGDNPFSSPEIRTPNLDKLAARSLVMTKAYTQVLSSSELGAMFDEATLGSLSALQKLSRSCLQPWLGICNWRRQLQTTLVMSGCDGGMLCAGGAVWAQSQLLPHGAAARHHEMLRQRRQVPRQLARGGPERVLSLY